MWSEREISIAKQLTDKETIAFLRKVLCEINTNNGEILEQNVIALDDAEYGRLMKVNYLSKKENKAKLALIQKIAKTKKGDKKKKLAPE